MATSIPPHNVSEVCDGIIKVIDNPDVTIDELMTIIKGPDFPTGALICGVRGIHDGYKTGRGTISVRAKAHIETAKNGRKSIVVTEIPYQLNRDRIIERIAELVKSEVLKGITDIRNESDREGSRIVIVVKKNDDENVVLNQLYKHTKLQDSFSIIMIAIVNNRPQTLNLKQLIIAYIDHRKEVIQRRTQFLLDRAEERAHILEGLKIALANIDEVIKLIKASKTVDDARNSLISKFSLSDVQANAILEMRLQRLTNLEQSKIEEEYKKVCDNIKEFKAILADENLVLDIVREDLHETKEKYGDERKTEIAGDVDDFDMEDLISEEDVTVMITHEGYTKRLPLDTYRKQNRGGKGVTGAGMKEGDFVENLFIASTHDYILFFTDLGKVYWLKVYDVPHFGRVAKGRAIVNLLNLQEDENVTSMIPVRKFDDKSLVMATKNGIIKKTILSAFGRPKKGGIIAILLDSGDKLIGVKLAQGGQEIVLGTENGKAIRFSEDDVRCMGRATRGVKGITLQGDDTVKGIVIVDKNATLLTVCENGFGKRTDYSEYTVQRRSGQGVINIKTTDRNGKVVALINVSDEDEFMMMTANGMIIRSAIKAIRSIGRNTQGVRLISLKEGDKLVSVAPVVSDESEESEGAETQTDEAEPQQPEQTE
jgi:DNA gyrase subunit A